MLLCLKIKFEIQTKDNSTLRRFYDTVIIHFILLHTIYFFLKTSQFLIVANRVHAGFY